jgi:hypothetical protein
MNRRAPGVAIIVTPHCRHTKTTPRDCTLLQFLKFSVHVVNMFEFRDLIGLIARCNRTLTADRVMCSFEISACKAYFVSVSIDLTKEILAESTTRAHRSAEALSNKQTSEQTNK